MGLVTKIKKTMIHPEFEFVVELELSENTKASIKNLLLACFPNADHNGRTYYKQLPHYRLLMKIDNELIGQLGMDYRIMNLNNNIVRVLGGIDLAIHPTQQGKGLGALLMKEFEKFAQKNHNNIDFLFLVTTAAPFYEKLGYRKTSAKVTWLKIHEGKNYGLGNEEVDDCMLMYKCISDKKWTDGELDMLGYWY